MSMLKSFALPVSCIFSSIYFLIFSILLLSLFSSLYSQMILAKDKYQYELNIDRASISDNARQVTNTRAVVDVFLSPVKYGDYPYAEASFVDRHSAIGLMAVYKYHDYSSDHIISNLYSVKAEFSENKYPVTIGFYIGEQKTSGDINLSQVNGGVQAISIDGDIQVREINTGLYVTKFLYFSAAYFEVLNETSYNQVLAYRNDEQGLNGHLHYLHVFSGNRYFKLSLFAGMMKSTEYDEIENNLQKVNTYQASISGTYYFNKSVSIEAGIMEEKMRNAVKEGGRELYLRISRYYTPKTNLHFEIGEYRADHGDDDNDLDVLSFGLTHRF